MNDCISEIILTEQDLQHTVKSLGEQITKDYKGKNLLLVTLLKGSVIFLTDLMRSIKLDCKIDFMVVSSYTGTQNGGGNVNILKDLSMDITGLDVLIVEDIIESGYTLNCVIEMIKLKNPNSIEICTLLDKPQKREVEMSAKYVGKVIPDKFVIGYGLDYNEIYRNLPFVGVLNPEKI